MPLLIRDLSLSFDEPEALLPERAARRLRLPADAIRACAVVRRSLDARRGGRIQRVFNLEIALHGGEVAEGRALRRRHRADVQWLPPIPAAEVRRGREPIPHRPIVVGYGPAGMFAAWALAEQGYAPIVLERGRDVRTRHRDILQRYYRERDFDGESNLLFGEGGAGCYSDGKLYTRIHDPFVRDVLALLFRFGAPGDILIEGRPHLGSDRLPTICRLMREATLAAGAEIRFGHRLDDITLSDGRLTQLTAGSETVPVAAMLLCVGHSARDTVRMLARRGVAIEAKAFQFGVRIEQPQEAVDRWQYGPPRDDAPLPPAEYHLTAQRAAGAGDVFSFCMCPGGLILPSNESPGLIATNGASRAARGSPFANSGLVMTILPDVFGDDPMAGLDYVESWERAAFALTGGSYEVPAQRADDFLAGRTSSGKLRTSYPLGGRWAEIRRVLPAETAAAVERALEMFERRFPGFAGPQTLVTGPESRASSPIRIPRDPRTRESINAAGLYPVGEGAGYAGGIISAAVDGIRTAQAIMSRYAPAEKDRR